MHKWFTWVARGIAIAGIAFISIFALDVFEPGRSVVWIVTALFMHLIPAFVLLAILAVAWRFELVGGLAYLAICVVPFAFLPNEVWVNATLAAPFALSGALFVAAHFAARRSGHDLGSRDDDSPQVG